MSEQANDKHMVCSHPTWNIKSAKRAGPIRTYLPLAQQRDNFSLRLGTTVIRLVHAGSRVTGDEVQGSNGTREIINLSKNGRVVLSAGALATPRVLFNSGIGPKEQIEVAANTGVTLPSQNDWIELPVARTSKTILFLLWISKQMVHGDPLIALLYLMEATPGTSTYMRPPALAL